MTFVIEARVSSVLGLGGHIYIDFWDGNNLVAQINGLARNPLTGELSYAGQDNWKVEAVVTP